jgi:hypothetical protein
MGLLLDPLLVVRVEMEHLQQFLEPQYIIAVVVAVVHR